MNIILWIKHEYHYPYKCKKYKMFKIDRVQFIYKINRMKSTYDSSACQAPRLLTALYPWHLEIIQKSQPKQKKS